MSCLVSQSRFVNEALEAHNRCRRLHGCMPLENDETLNRMAIEWAERLADEDRLVFRNTEYKGEPLGENILRANTVYFSGNAVTDEWYAESKSYKYDGKFSPSAGHFTQLIWKNTRKVGFGFAQNDKGRFYVVANYYPAGNYKGEFDVCVPPVLGTLTSSKTTTITKSTANPDSNTTKTTAYIITRTNTQDGGAPKTTITKATLSTAPPPPLPSSSPSYMPLTRNTPLPPDTTFTSATPSYSSGGNGSGTPEQFIKEALAAHNTYRKKHGVDPLHHNQELSKIAQKYAEYIASIGQLKHSTNTYNGQKLGENLAFFYDTRMNFYPGDKAVEQWYSEIKDYRYRDYQPGTGHFTQVVWKASREVGFGVAKARDGSWYAVANYYPAGNLIGTFSENVPRPIY